MGLHVSGLSLHSSVYLQGSSMPPPTAHMPSDADLGGPDTVLSLYSCLTSYTYTVYASQFTYLMGTYIHWVLLFAWVLLFKKWIATGFMGTYIHRVLVFDGYLYSRVYGSITLTSLQPMCRMLKYKNRPPAILTWPSVWYIWPP